MIEVVTKSESQLDVADSNSSISTLDPNLCLPLHEKEHSNEPKKDKAPADPILLHPSLLCIPTGIRYGLAGLLANTIFCFFHHLSMQEFEKFNIAKSTIYAIVYFFFIPVNHFILNIFVFGWPASYISSLVNNYIVGFCAIIVGATCTAYLEKIKFEVKADLWVRQHVTSKIMNEFDDLHSGSTFYTTVLVLSISGILSYGLFFMFNIPTSKSEKKVQ